MTTDVVEKCASDLCVAIWGMDYRPRPGMMPDARWSTALHATLAVKFSEAADMIEQLEAEVVECERVCSALRRGDKP